MKYEYIANRRRAFRSDGRTRPTVFLMPFLGETSPPKRNSLVRTHQHPVHGCHRSLAGDIVLGVNLCRSLETPNLQGLHCDVTAEMLQQLQHEGVELWLWQKIRV